MQSGIDYSGSVSDQNQHFMMKHFMHQQFQQESGRLQPVQQPVFQSPDSPENHNSLRNRLKQEAQTVNERCPDEDIDAVEERGERNSEANRWSSEETLALLRIRAAICGNSGDSNEKGPVWETVSRKLAEMGFQRSAKKCKEKFENVYKYYKKTRDGRMNRQGGKSYRFCSEIEALYAGVSMKNGGIDKGADIGACSNTNIANQGDVRNSSSVYINQLQDETTLPRSTETIDNTRQNLSSDGTSTEEDLGKSKSELQINRKRRKRKQSLSSVKDLLENVIKSWMERQENSQRKFLEAIEKRDQDRFIIEEAWKRQEMARVNRETELRAKEHALQSSREKAIIEFLEKLTSQNFKLDPVIIPIPSPPKAHKDENNTERGKLDPHSRRWPKSEVYALIKLRSDMDQRFTESGPKVALWEEISSTMACMGFHRSPKRCKEKWENINKYFRKTKGSLKKRPLSSKTCPYFHQLHNLYYKGDSLSRNHVKSDKNLENSLNSEALTGIDDDSDKQERGQEMKGNDQEPDLLGMAAASTQPTVQPASTSREGSKYLAQTTMSWNPTVIQTMDDQAVSVNYRPSSDYLGRSSNDDDNTKRMKMERLNPEGLEPQQNQYQEFFVRRRDHEEQQRSDEELGHRQQQQIQQRGKYQVNLVPKPKQQQHSQRTVSHSASQSAVLHSGLMDLVHNLSTNYSISAPASITE